MYAVEIEQTLESWNESNIFQCIEMWPFCPVPFAFPATFKLQCFHAAKSDPPVFLMISSECLATSLSLI